MVKSEKFGHLHLVYHFAIPLIFCIAVQKDVQKHLLTLQNQQNICCLENTAFLKKYHHSIKSFTEIVKLTSQQHHPSSSSTNSNTRWTGFKVIKKLFSAALMGSSNQNLNSLFIEGFGSSNCQPTNKRKRHLTEFLWSNPTQKTSNQLISKTL